MNRTITLHHEDRSTEVTFDPDGPIVDISDAFLYACHELGYNDDEALEAAERLTFKYVK